jgi:hypothetical protein
VHPAEGRHERHRPPGPWPVWQEGVVCAADRREKIDALEQQIGMDGAHLDLAASGSDETILERVGDLHGRLDADDPRGTFERVCRTHHRFDRLGRLFEAFDGKNAGRQHGRLRVGLEPEQLEHRKTAQILCHGMLLSVALGRGPGVVIVNSCGSGC